MTETFDKNLMKQRMDKTLISFQNDLNTVRAGRATVNMLATVFIEAYGSKVPINQIGNINVPEPRLLVISVWDSSNVEHVEKGIRESNLGLNPMVEGNLIRLPIPALSEERRIELTKVVSKYAENTRVSLRNIRRDIIDDIRKKEKNKEISTDEKHKNEEIIQAITDEYVNNVDKILSNKEKEILEV